MADDIRREKGSSDPGEMPKSNENYTILKFLIDAAPESIFLVDRQGTIQIVNATGAKRLNGAVEELTGKNIFDLLSPDKAHSRKSKMEEVIQSGKTIHYQDKWIDIVFGNSIVPIVDPSGKVNQLVIYEADISECIGELNELRINAERLELALSVSNDGMYDWDILTNKIYFDPRYYTMAGYEPNEFPGTFDEWAKRVHPEDYKKTKVAVNAFLAGETAAYDEEFRFKRKDGKWMWIRARVKIVEQAEDGSPLRMVGTHSDINLRKEAEIKLREQTHVFEESQRVANIGSYSLDIASMRWFGSETLHQIFGITGCESSHSVEEWTNLLHPDFRADISTALFNFIEENGDVFDRDYKIIRADDGVERWVRGRGQLTLNDAGAPLSMIGTIQDITQEKQAKLTHERLETAINQSDDTVVITDTDGAIVYANPAFEKTTGYTCHEALGQNTRILKSGKHDDRFYKNLWETITHGNTWDGILTNRRKNGTLYEEKATISPVVDASGTIVNYVAVKSDITKEQSLERAQTFFRDATSHELRTPLTQLKLLQLLSENLVETYPDDENVDKSHCLTNDIYSSIDRIVTATRLQSDLMGELKVPLQTIKIKPLMEYRIELAKHEAMAVGRNIQIHTKLDDISTNAEIMGSIEMIEKVFIEILSNAIKYTHDEGAVSVTATTDDRDIVIEIFNTGEAIPEGSEALLFAPYSSIEDINEHSTGQYKYKGGGIGLGLTIAKMIMEYHDGSVGLESNADKKGTSVFLRFPLAT